MNQYLHNHLHIIDKFHNEQRKQHNSIRYYLISCVWDIPPVSIFLLFSINDGHHFFKIWGVCLHFHGIFLPFKIIIDVK